MDETRSASALSRPPQAITVAIPRFSRGDTTTPGDPDIGPGWRLGKPPQALCGAQFAARSATEPLPGRVDESRIADLHLQVAVAHRIDRPNALALAFYAAVAGVDIAIIHAMNTALERLGRERERSAALLETSETMFKELQHRVSNNLQLVSSLLRLQGSSVEDPGARRALEEASGRLALLGRLHRRLYDPAGAPAGFGEHLKELCREVLDASGARGVVCIVDAGAGVALPPERSIPVALIALELVSNALEHAFAGREGGTITMDLRPGADGSFLLKVEDDGAGLPRGFDPRTAGGLGLRLVGALARQIGGTFEMSGGRGTVCRLSFPA